MDRYRLLKDTFNDVAGDVFHWDEALSMYVREREPTVEVAPTVVVMLAIPKQFVENNPEWFSKIEEPGWVIESLTDHNSNIWLEVDHPGIIKRYFKEWSIECVQRTSDKQSFAVKDTVQWGKIWPDKMNTIHTGVITGFVFNKDRIFEDRPAYLAFTTAEYPDGIDFLGAVELRKISNEGRCISNDWMILKGRDPVNGEIHDWVPENNATRLANCIIHQCEIYSVKRLSDGEVFSVGDEVRHHKDQWFQKILSFDIYDHPSEGRMCRAILKALVTGKGYWNIKWLTKKSPKPEQQTTSFVWTDDNVADILFQFSIGVASKDLECEPYKFIKKFKEQSNHSSTTKERVPLFVTNDGVTMYMGDSYYYCLDKKFKKYAIKICSGQDIKGIVRFSTEEKLDEYIAKQKPERIEVSVLKQENFYSDPRCTDKHVSFHVPIEIPISTLPAIKTAIENILNDPSDAWRKTFLTAGLTLYTQEEMDKAIADAFNGARENYKYPMSGLDESLSFYPMYSTLESYRESLKKKQ